MKTISTSLIFVFFLNVFFLFEVSAQSVQAAEGAQPEQAARIWADSLLAQMSQEEKIGQLFMIDAYSNQNETYESRLEQQIRKYHVGGLIFFQGDPVRQVQLTRRFQQVSRYPLLIGMDAEHGVGWRLEAAMEFPKMLIAGAIRNDSLAYALGAAIARHCRMLGVHVNFAPVVDISSNPRNPVIGMRSFGEQREEVTRKALAYARGTLSQDVLPVVKHFPGHGDTGTDSHHTLPVIQHSRVRLDSIELYPYYHLIAAGIPAVMTSHLDVKALDSTGCPASLSSAVIENLLKKRLGFEGLCFTDAMNMKGVVGNTAPGQAEVKALLAGNDVLLFPANLAKAVAGICKAVEDGTLSQEVIDRKCRKILEAKYRYALANLYPAETPGLWSRLHQPEDFVLKQKLYKTAITLVRNTDSLLPLRRLDTLRIASLNFGGKEINNFQTMLSRYATVRHFTVGKNLTAEEIRVWKKKLEPYNCVVIYNQSASNRAGQSFGFSSSLEALIRQLTEKRIIFCQPGIPYGLVRYLNLPVDVFLVSYENQLYAQQYAGQAVFGGIAVSGQLPVSIGICYPAGIGIQTQKTRLGYDTPEMEGIASARLAAIDSLCEQAIRLQATPGCQVLVARNGEIIYNKAFGFHTYEKKRANQISDIYDVASVTKITSTLPVMMKLYDDRKISLDGSLSEDLPVLKTTDKKDITYREVLCHNAGLKAFIPLFAEAVDKKSLPGPLFSSVRTRYNTTRLKDRLYVNLNYRFRDSTISNTPRPGYVYLAPGLYLYPSYQDTVLQTILNTPRNSRKEYLYSDVGFIFLKYAAENLTGEPIDQYCKKHFFDRLGMKSTAFKAIDRLPRERVVPSCIDKLYRKTEICGTVHDPAAAILGGIAGHAGLFSTAEDLAKMMQLYLNGGNYGGEYYFSPETVMTFTGKNSVFPRNRRGLGFDKPEPDSTRIGPTSRCTPLSTFGHTGFTGIMAWADPENHLIYIFLSNRTYPDEFNTKLSEENIRTRIQEIIYEALRN